MVRSFISGVAEIPKIGGDVPPFDTMLYTAIRARHSVFTNRVIGPGCQKANARSFAGAYACDGGPLSWRQAL